MSQSKKSSEDVTRHHAYGYITSHINYIKHLPSPDEGKWTTSDVPKGVKNQIRNLHDNAIVTQHTTDDEGEEYRDRFYYSTNRKAYRDLQHVLESFRFTPCGHTGVSNLGDGRYSCGYEFCSETFGRGAAREALGMTE